MDDRPKKARQLRRQGWSIKAIARTIGAAQSSVSLWTRDIKLSPSQQQLLKNRSHSRQAIEKRRCSRLSNELSKRNKVIATAMTQVGGLTKRELWLIGTSLYWAEGGKTQRLVRFSNGDPQMILLMMRYFRESCGVPEAKFRGYIHIHESLDAKAAEEYWSQVAQIPLQRFYKTYNKPNSSSKGLRRTLPYGVLDIYVADVILFLKIEGWIQGIHGQELTES